jgi:hypothetical protein
MGRPPIGKQAMSDAERQRRRRERLRKDDASKAASSESALAEARKEIERLTEQLMKERGARWRETAPAAWIKDHPGHTAADFERWGSCSATVDQARHFEDWVFAFEKRKAEPQPQALIEAREEIERLRARVAKLEKPEQVPEGAATAEEWAAAKRAVTRTQREPQPAPTKTPTAKRRQPESRTPKAEATGPRRPPSSIIRAGARRSSVC